jgi:hypothetical protein
MAVPSIFVMKANAQVTEQSAREQASNIVRSELPTTMNLKPDQFLSVQRDETLEQSLALAVGRTGGVAHPQGAENSWVAYPRALCEGGLSFHFGNLGDNPERTGLFLTFLLRDDSIPASEPRTSNFQPPTSNS